MSLSPEETLDLDTSILLENYRLNQSLHLKNRLVMSPMTRTSADDELVPTQAMAQYYARRADAGLIISESTDILANALGHPNTPGIFTAAQVAGWQRVTDLVHENGGLMFLQLRHVGRVTHPDFIGGEIPVAPSAVRREGSLPKARHLNFVTPRALETEEVPHLVDAFAEAARRAMAAGFDGVEIHGGNGYLIDQFLHYQTNLRGDDYGGSPENLARFALETVKAVAAVVGVDRVGLRLSPGAGNCMPNAPGDVAVFQYLLAQLSNHGLAYLHTGVFDDSEIFADLGSTVGTFMRQGFQGKLMGNGSYRVPGAIECLSQGRFDLMSFGRLFLANPDLVTRLESGAPLRDYNSALLESLH